MPWRVKGSPLDNLSGANVTDLRGFALVRKCCCAGTLSEAVHFSRLAICILRNHPHSSASFGPRRTGGARRLPRPPTVPGADAIANPGRLRTERRPRGSNLSAVELTPFWLICSAMQTRDLMRTVSMMSGLPPRASIIL
jgi:hypothetical protein